MGIFRIFTLEYLKPKYKESQRVPKEDFTNHITHQQPSWKVLKFSPKFHRNICNTPFVVNCVVDSITGVFKHHN